MNETLIDVVNRLEGLSDEALAECIMRTNDVQWCLSELRDILGVIEDMPVSRLRELVHADKEGKCVICRFGLGSTIYRTWERPDGSHAFVSDHKMQTAKDLLNAETWHNAYETREAAEKAMEKEESQDG